MEGNFLRMEAEAIVLPVQVFQSPARCQPPSCQLATQRLQVSLKLLPDQLTAHMREKQKNNKSDTASNNSDNPIKYLLHISGPMVK